MVTENSQWSESSYVPLRDAEKKHILLFRKDSYVNNRKLQYICIYICIYITRTQLLETRLQKAAVESFCERFTKQERVVTLLIWAFQQMRVI